MNEQQVSEIHAIEAEFDNPDARNTWYMALEIHRLRAEIARLRAAETAAFRRGVEAMKSQVKAYCVALVLAGQRGEFGPEVDALPLPEDKR